MQSYVSENAQEASAACCGKIIELLGHALAQRPAASIAISGGTTPKLLFGEMAKAKFDWTKVHLFWVDERCVLPTDGQSNYKLARENFIDPANFPAANVHRIQGELDPQEGSKLYTGDIRKFFDLAEGQFPQFDIIHRGMGPDCHTASLFPGEPQIDDRTHLTGAVYVEKFKQSRVTLLAKVLEEARNTLMLVAGDDKAEPLRTILNSPYDPQKYPVQIGTLNNSNAAWFLDKAAARLIA